MDKNIYLKSCTMSIVFKEINPPPFLGESSKKGVRTNNKSGWVIDKK